MRTLGAFGRRTQKTIAFPCPLVGAHGRVPIHFIHVRTQRPIIALKAEHPLRRNCSLPFGDGESQLVLFETLPFPVKSRRQGRSILALLPYLLAIVELTLKQGCQALTL